MKFKIKCKDIPEDIKKWIGRKFKVDSNFADQDYITLEPAIDPKDANTIQIVSWKDGKRFISADDDVVSPDWAQNLVHQRYWKEIK